MMDVRIGDRVIGPDHPPYIIAEIGVNHDGSTDRAIELVHAAKSADADAIKLQLFETDRLLSKAAKLAIYQQRAGATDPFAMLRALELSVDQMHRVIEHAKQLELHTIVTVFSVELVAHARRLNWQAYKTASPDIINQPLLEQLMTTGKPLLISAGAASIDEVQQVTRWLGDHPHILFQCVSSYPTPDDSAALAARIAMSHVNPNALGYSDHTSSLDTGALAVASGARMLEKHLTYDRSASGPDHAASLDPAGFAEYVRLAHRAFRMLGPVRKQVLDIEADVRHVSRQSLTAARDLPIGHVLQASDVTIKRPGTGIAPFQLHDVLGRRLAKAVEADMPITQEDLL